MHTARTFSLERIHLCLNFVRDYGNIIEHATPHLYLSALAQAPAILGTTLHRFTALPEVIRTSEHGTNTKDPSVTYMTLHGHTGRIRSVEFSRDGKYVVTASRDETVRIWDTQTYSQFGDPLIGHTGAVWSACFSSDGMLVVSTSIDGTVRIWNAKSEAHEQVRESFKRHKGAEKASFLSNGTHVVSASEDTILFWDTTTQAEIAQPLHNRGLVFAFSPDGKCIALPTGDDSSSLEILVVQTGARVGQLLTGHHRSVSAVAFSPDGQHIATLGKDGILQIWDARTGTRTNVMTGRRRTRSIAFYLDEEHIMTSGDHGIQFWDMNTKSQIRQVVSREISRASRLSALSPNGDRFASVSYDYSVRIWSFDLLADHLARTTTYDFDLTSASYSPDGKYITTACDDKSVRIWDAETCSQVGNPLTGHSRSVNSASFSPDGRLIVTASTDETVRVWNAQTGAQTGEPLTGHTAPIISASFSPDGTCLLSADTSTVRVWSAGRSDLGKLIQVIEVPSELWIQSVSFSPGGKLIALNTNDYTQVLDPNTGSDAAIVPLEFRDSFVCFSPDERLLLFFGKQHNNLHLWNAESRRIEKVFRPRGHTDAVLKASFSPDGKHIVSASKDYTICVWNTETGSQTAIYQNLGNIHSLEYLKTLEVSPDGSRILSMYYHDVFGSHIRIWAMPHSLPLGTDLNYSPNDPNVCK